MLLLSGPPLVLAHCLVPLKTRAKYVLFLLCGSGAGTTSHDMTLSMLALCYDSINEIIMTPCMTIKFAATCLFQLSLRNAVPKAK